MTDKKPAPLQEWQRDAIAAEPRGFMEDIIQASRQRSESASLIPDRQRSEEKPRPPSGGTVPIQPPPGLRWIDAQCDAQDKRDRAMALRQRIESAWIESHFDKGPRIESEYEPFSRQRMDTDD
jgi:hypothetical protein